MPADDGDWVLRRVDCDGYAELLPREAALAGLSGALRQLRVVDVYLVDPDPAPEHDAVLVAPHGGKHAVAPLEGRLVGDAAELAGGVKRHVPGHELDEPRPSREVLLAALEDGPGQGAEPRPARATAEPAPPCGRPAVPDDVPRFAARTAGPGPEGCGRLVEGAEADVLAAEARGHGPLQQHEFVAGHLVDALGVGVVGGSHSVVPSTQAPTRPGRRQT